MAVRNHFHNAKAGVESPVTKKLSGIRLLFADLKFMRRTHYIMQFYRIHLCVLLTKQDFHFTNMHLAYKTGFSFYKYASRLQSVAFRFTNGTLGLQFIDVALRLKYKSIIYGFQVKRISCDTIILYFVLLFETCLIYSIDSKRD